MKKELAVKQYQTGFKKFLLEEPSLDVKTIVADIIVPEGLKGSARKRFIEKRLNIYKNNLFYSLSEKLGKLYPVVKRVLGEDCFNAVAKSYIQQYPPKEPALTFYGKFFSEFITSVESCSHLRYLSDLALLEWHCQLAMNADNVNILDPAVITQKSEQELGLLKLPLHPSVQFVISDYPVGRIWEENQKIEAGEAVDSEASKSYLLIYRKAFQVEVLNLSPLIFDLLLALDWGESINDAWKQIKNDTIDDNEFTGVLVYLLSLGVFAEEE